MVGKFVDLSDSYKSLNEALAHGGIANEVRVEVTHVDSERIEKDGIPDVVRQADGILVPMGFGPRGTEGKIEAVRHAREGKVPFLGICFGMQMAVVEFAVTSAAWSARTPSGDPAPLPRHRSHVQQRELETGAAACSSLLPLRAQETRSRCASTAEEHQRAPPPPLNSAPVPPPDRGSRSGAERHVA
jgi:hypothetical protein